jgi:hypothetical protein
MALINMKRIILFLFLITACSDKKDLIVENIIKGEDKASIINKLGQPNKIISCDENLWWGNGIYLGKDINKTCKNYFIYEGMFLKRVGIGFDNKNKVITKYTYVSE